MENLPEYQGWKTVRLIGTGSFGSVYEIERNLFGTVEKAALKVISIPQSESEIEELYSSGYDDKSITAHFNDYLADIVREYSMMLQIKGHTNVVYCDDVKYIEKEDGLGWTIYIKMELLTPLMKVLDKTTDEAQVIKLANDLCNALVLCESKGIIHRDIKPQNIFVSKDGDYKLGDFGIAKTIDKTSGGTKIGTYNYMAPEVYNNEPYGHSADIYSLGLVLYWLLNERRYPFCPLPPSLPTSADLEKSRLRRFRGDSLPEPINGSDELKRIVLKACAFNPADRYKSAAEMLADLASISKKSLFETMVASIISEAAESSTNAGEKEGSKQELICGEEKPGESADDGTVSLLWSKNKRVIDQNPTVSIDIFEDKKTGSLKTINPASQQEETPVIVLEDGLSIKNQKQVQKGKEEPRAEQESSEKKRLKIGLFSGLGVALIAIVIILILLLKNCGFNGNEDTTDSSFETESADSGENPVMEGLTTVEIESVPEKLFYHIGDRLNTKGLSLTASFTDGSTKTITEDYRIEPEVLEESGTQKIRVFYGGMETGFDVVVSSAVMTAVEIKNLPEKKEYYLGESIDLTGLELTAQYSDGTSETVTDGFETTVDVLTSSGEVEIPVTYNGLRQSFTVNVDEVSLSGLEIVNSPKKTTYFVGDRLDTSGLKLKALYDNGTEEELTGGFTVSPEKLEKAGNQKITIVYGSQTVEFAVEVSDIKATSITITSQPTKKEYYTGDALETSGLTLRIKYSNGSEETVTSGFTCSPSVLNNTGTQKVTVSYGGKTTTFTVSVTAVAVQSISIASQPTKTSYTTGENVDMAGLALTVTFNNGKTETVTSGFTVSPSTLSTSGNQTITVTYQGKTTTYSVTVTAPSTPSTSVNVGDTITFGPYQWIVLNKNGSNVMLITKEAIACKKYNETSTNVTWETCTLRSWLNSSFLGEFSAADQAKILTTTVSNPNNPECGTTGGNTTYDKVFLLSIDEALTYFSSDMERQCAPNATAISQGVHVDSDFTTSDGKPICNWWLRSPGGYSTCAAFVPYEGFVDDEYGCGVDDGDIGVRPALWVNLGN